MVVHAFIPLPVGDFGVSSLMSPVDGGSAKDSQSRYPHHFNTEWAPLAARCSSAALAGMVLMTANISLLWYRNLLLGSVYRDGKPVISQYFFCPFA
jgi:hypothetical protein